MRIKHIEKHTNTLIQVDSEIEAAMEHVKRKYRNEKFAYLLAEMEDGEYKRIYGADRLGRDTAAFRLL